VAAVNGALSSGLSSMVGNLTYSKKEYKNVREEMISIAEKAQYLKDFFLEAMDKDTDAFNKIMEGFSLPKKTQEDIEFRNKRIMEATKEATLVPLFVLEKSKEAADLALLVAEKGNRNSLSDAGVSGLTASAAAEAALFNVMINLESIDDESFKKKVRTQALQLNKKVQNVVMKIKNLLNKELNISS
jgi:glutamate formiminotransferase/formiminotetrahydrofolate cyclodeaminase